MLSEEVIIQNWERYLSVINQEISSPRKEILLKFMNEYEDRLSTMPASSKNWYHSAYPGGYVDHVLRVLDCAIYMAQGYKQFGGTINYTKEELVFSALFHDLGKFGLPEAEYYIPNDSQWHIDKLGQIYKYNEQIPPMKVPERSLYLLQNMGVKLTHNEYLGIKLHDGLYDDSNKYYYMSSMKETKPRTHLFILLHHADHMAAQIEYENWLEATESNLLNNNGSVKTDSNHPSMNGSTLKAINSFFES